jgi:hypothetical protein
MDAKELAAALAAPFPADRVAWKLRATSQDEKRALVVPCLDARDVVQRLDDVAGPLGWQVDHKQIGEQLVTGLAVRDLRTGVFVWKWDTGGDCLPANRPSGADPESEDGQARARQAPLSDSFKRAAALWGIGRYLDRLPKTWAGWDAEHQRLTSVPRLPEWALPDAQRAERAPRAATPKGKPPVARRTPPGSCSGTAHPAAGKPASPAGDARRPMTIREANAFVCPVEIKDHPEYKGKPLAELLLIAPKFVEWLATGLDANGDPERQAVQRAASVLLAVEPDKAQA